MSLREEEGGERVSDRGSVRSLGHFIQTGKTQIQSQHEAGDTEEEEEEEEES